MRVSTLQREAASVVSLRNPSPKERRQTLQNSRDTSSRVSRGSLPGRSDSKGTHGVLLLLDLTAWYAESLKSVGQ